MDSDLADSGTETTGIFQTMQYSNLDALIDAGPDALQSGPIAVILIEDDVEVFSTIRHHQTLGFETLVVIMPQSFDLPPAARPGVLRVDSAGPKSLTIEQVINTLMDSLAGQWVFYCYNTEYLFYPFCESRNIHEMLAFHQEERRDAMLSYVVDLYAADLDQHPNAVSLPNAHLDRSGYYALARLDPANQDHPKERQLDFFGGLRWRYEEHVPKARRKIDRISLFRARKGLRMRGDYTFEDEEYNTYACPWHHNITAAVCSFRTAKALKTNPGSTFEIHNFKWHNSTRFRWDSRQLLDLGLIEPGQWF
jgi:hypothetical protein